MSLIFKVRDKGKFWSRESMKLLNLKWIWVNYKANSTTESEFINKTEISSLKIVDYNLK